MSSIISVTDCRSPHGERGLKLYATHTSRSPTLSLSSRRAWIEILSLISIPAPRWRSLSSRRAWIEIAVTIYHSITAAGRSPHGERGLKLPSRYIIVSRRRSLSSRRAWIEICVCSIAAKNKIMSLSSRRAWIEITSAYLFCKNNKSRSPHGERGLKFCVSRCYPHDTIGRSPHGERGLKYL